MYKVIGLFSILLMQVFAGCSSNTEERAFEDPLSGEKVVLKFGIQDGWGIYTAAGSKLLIVTKNDEPLMQIVDSKKGREITVISEGAPLGTVSITDKNYDQVYEVIKYRNGAVEVTDAGLDGEIDAILDFDKEMMSVNYRGELIQLRGVGDKKYIVADGNKRDMEYVDGVFVPSDR